MSANRNVKRSLWLLSAATAAVWLMPAAAMAQHEAVQRPFESGRFEEALNAAAGHRDDPASVYIAGQAASRLEQPDRAREEFQRLASSGDQSWQLTGKAALAAIDGNIDEARNLADQAVQANGDNAFAHFQLGIAASRQGDHARAGEAFARAAELRDNLAYAHYYAALEFQRVREGAKAGDHLRRFLELAPDAPERGAAQQLLRSLRG